MIRDHHVREVAHSGVLRRLERQLARLDLELIAARCLGEEAWRQERVVEVDGRRRRSRTSSKRDRSAGQDPQFPHQGFSLFVIIAAGKLGSKRVVPTVDVA